MAQDNSKMHMSEEGLKALDREEGDVLKAYRDVTGTLTIGKGLTKASGVIDPKPGMIITKKESARLTLLALERNYEPAVRLAMPDAAQHEFDGACSFHWNTGAIGRASWVDRWKATDWPGVRAGLLAWNKSKGKVFPGLTARRAREYDIIHMGLYGFGISQSSHPMAARFAVPMTPPERETVRVELGKLGYVVGDTQGVVLKAAVHEFQKDHALTRDGIIGRATLATLQRRIDAKRKVTTAAAAPVGATAASTAPVTDADQSLVDALSGQPWIGPALIAAGLAVTAWVIWSYRDVVAVKIQSRLPRLAAKLRSL